MKNRTSSSCFGVPLLLALAALSSSAQNRRVVSAELTGFQEVPAISSTGTGKFRARLDDASIEFELTYSDLEGIVQQAHIHIGQAGVVGGIMIYFCSNLANPPLGTPPCPQSGTVTGTRMASDVIGPAGQGIAPGEFEEVLRAIRSGNTYANVHTAKHPGGEIRGKVN
ncbi:MAG: CHRD domain-containing protein [Acidobacteria bacterium]|nr:CHRD domain-containing protein [Acidobacteriota bacterium]